MQRLKQAWGQKVQRQLLIGLAAWLAIMLVAYLIVTVRALQHQRDVRRVGTEITHVFATRVRLPLLEKNIPAVQALLREASQQSAAVYASVLDHQRQIIAHTGNENFVPAEGAIVGAPPADQVAVDEGQLRSDQKVFRFTAGVTYAGTPIGEVIIAKAVPDTDRVLAVIRTAAVLSGLILLLIFLALRFESVGRRLYFLKSFVAPTPPQAAIPPQATIICPLCGSLQHVAEAIFNGEHTAPPFDRERTPEAFVDWRTLARNGEFAWFKRSLLRRCADIINRLAD